MKVTLTLTDAQVVQIARKVAVAGLLSPLLSGFDDPKQLGEALKPFFDDPRYSRSTLRALSVLCAFSNDGGERDLKDIAKELGLSAATTHRYVSTWAITGLLEQDPDSRRYRRARTREDTGAGA